MLSSLVYYETLQIMHICSLLNQNTL